jgi:hypothetical protein
MLPPVSESALRRIMLIRDYTRERFEIPTAICGRTEETSITDSHLWKIQMLVSIA